MGGIQSRSIMHLVDTKRDVHLLSLLGSIVYVPTDHLILFLRQFGYDPVVVERGVLLNCTCRYHQRDMI